MKPIISETIQMNKDGQLTMPGSILVRYDIHDEIEFKIQLMPDGITQLTPNLPFPKSFYMESSQEILEGAVKG